MDNQYRIKIAIKLNYQNRGFNKDNFILTIKVLKKDIRFNINPDLTKKADYSACTYTGSNGFSIVTNNQDFKGSLEIFSLNIPNKKYLNRKIKISFMTDNLRKVYLMHLYRALIEWASEWGPFTGESKPLFKATGNMWYIYISNK